MTAYSKIQGSEATKHASGFSLIEVAMGLIILGILTVPLIQMYKVYRINEIKVRSEQNLGVISTALQKYVIRNGRYPLPAEGNIAGGAPGEGVEIIDTSVAFPCAANMTTVCETPGPPLDRVYIGTVPFATLGLPKSYALDGYANRFTYAVTKELTTTGGFGDTKGKIQILDRAGGDKDETASNIHYVLISHGPNGKGTTTNAGVLYANCAGAGKDIENCDNDGVFNSNFAVIGTGGAAVYGRYSSDVPGADYFDDYMYYVITTAADMWTPRPNLATPDLYNRNSGNVRVGSWTAGPLNGVTIPSAKLDIAGGMGNPGNLKADQVNTNRLCSFTETGATYTGCLAALGAGTPKKRVFTPTIIGGDPDPGDNFPNTSGNGIFCGSRGMSGIAEADEKCSNAIPAATITVDSSCALSGYAGRRIVAGVLYCEAP